MSAVVSFELKSKRKREEIHKSIIEAWQKTNSSRKAEVIPRPNGNSYYVVLSYYFGKDDEKSAIRNVVKYLFTISTDEKLYYFRDGFGNYPDFNKTLTIDEILSSDYEPSMDIQHYWRYQIVCDLQAGAKQGDIKGI